MLIERGCQNNQKLNKTNWIRQIKNYLKKKKEDQYQEEEILLNQQILFKLINKKYHKNKTYKHMAIGEN
jgi:hypothetical protein